MMPLIAYLARFGLALALALAVGLPSPRASAQDGEGDPGRVPFHFHGKTWRSQRAFIQSGARCATRHVAEIEAEQIQQALQRFLAGRRGADPGTPARSRFRFGST